MLGWIKKHWILSLFLLVGGVPAGLNYSGFCWEQKRWLSNEEFLISAVRYENNKKRMEIDGSDNSIVTFLKEYPECCILTRREAGMGAGEGLLPLISKITGLSYATVEVQYKLSETAHRQATYDDYGIGYLSINSCGKVVESFRGTKEKKYTRYKDNN